MKRRSFLEACAGLILWRPWPTANDPTQPIITDLGDGDFYIEAGPLHCALVRCREGSSVLGFDVYAAYPLAGIVEDRRMVPSELLKEKLADVGFFTVDGRNQIDPALGAVLPYSLTPDEVGKKLQQILAECDSRLLYGDHPFDRVAEPFNCGYGER